MNIYIYIYYERKKGRNYISRQACFVNRFTLQGFYIYIYIFFFFGIKQTNLQNSDMHVEL